MPIKGENGGYKYKAFINGEWHDLTLSDSPNKLTEWLQSHEEWARVKHGHWIEQEHEDWKWSKEYRCSECGKYRLMTNPFGREWNYCPNCGAHMGVEDGVERK